MGFGKSSQSSGNTSQQTSESKNQAYPLIKEQLGGQIGNVDRSNNVISSLLGLGGDGGRAGLDTFLNSSNYNFVRDEGIRGIDASNASRGLSQSGSALRGLSKYSSNLAQSFLDKYLGQLSGLSNSGLQSAQIITSAGNTSNSQGTSSGSSKGSSTNFSLG
jgi:hypothetical protein